MSVADTKKEALDRHHIKQVLELAVQAGDILLRSGAETSRVEETINILIQAFGPNFSNSLVTPTGLYVSIDDGNVNIDTPEEADSTIYPMTLIRRVRSRSLNYTRIWEVNNLSRRVAQGMVTLEQAIRELDRINHTPDLYPFWLRVLAITGLAAGTTMLLGGTPLDVAPALVSTILAQLLNQVLQRTRIPMLFSDLLGSILATGVVLFLVWLGVGIHANLVIAGGIIALVPGAALVASVQDGIGGDLISSVTRGLEALLKGAAIAAGVGLTLSAGLNWGIKIPLNQSEEIAGWQMPVQVAAAFFAASCYGIYSYIPRFAILTAGLAGGVGWFIHLMTVNVFKDSGLLATFLASFIAGIISWQLARWQHSPITLYILPGILPLLPGLSIYNGMLDLSQNQNVEGLLLLVRAIFLGGALAAGVALSNSLTLSIHHSRVLNK